MSVFVLPQTFARLVQVINKTTKLQKVYNPMPAINLLTKNLENKNFVNYYLKFN